MPDIDDAAAASLPAGPETRVRELGSPGGLEMSVV
jgi:hypothetical protein